MCTNLTRDFLEICCSIIFFKLHYYDKLWHLLQTLLFLCCFSELDLNNVGWWEM